MRTTLFPERDEEVINIASETRAPSGKNLILVGLEPTIPGSVGRCLIHWATGPSGKCRRADYVAPVYHCGDDFVRAGESKRAGRAELRSQTGTRVWEALQAHGQPSLATPGSSTPERGMWHVRRCHVAITASRARAPAGVPTATSLATGTSSAIRFGWL